MNSITLNILNLIRPQVPKLAGLISLGMGLMLLLSGATPSVNERLQILRDLVPLSLVEVSHLLGSIIGFALIALAYALYRRFDTAWQVTVFLLTTAAFFVLFKGGNWEETVALAISAVILIISRPAFYRKGSVWQNALSPGWLSISLLFVGLSIVVGMWAFGDATYKSASWWKTAYMAEAPRFLRASLVLLILGFGLLVARLFGRAPLPHTTDTVTDNIRQITASGLYANQNLALLGDKRFMQSDCGQAVLMYQIMGSSWIVMGEPMGPLHAWPNLIWKFREAADLHGTYPVFYQVRSQHLDVFADAGLVAHKIGEEARIHLSTFTTEGKKFRDLRTYYNRMEREGLEFKIHTASEFETHKDRLRAISDEWLTTKNGKEKAFSLGLFDEVYLRQFDWAGVWHNGDLIAFANLWSGADKFELSYDLMRHTTDAPGKTMAWFFLKMIQYAKDQGYEWFSLGMAPLAGMTNHRLAPTWQRLGYFAFHRGERLYGFSGLRRFKNQYRPEWRSRYLVCLPITGAFTRSMKNAAKLINNR